ncbi:MAG: hypothetical protein R3264_15730, partial [Anaerolineae bacterium]|nr:hypothetical protein [Anaerolineae bacterium]
MKHHNLSHLRSFTTTILILLGLYFNLGPTPLYAQQPITVDIEAGLDSLYKADMWGPIQVTIANDGPDVRAMVKIEDTGYRNTGTLYTFPVELPSQSRKHLAFSIPFRHSQNIEVDIVDENDDLLYSERVNLQIFNQEDFLVGVVASEPSLLNALAGLSAPNNARVGVAHLNLDDLSPSFQAWEALDMLVFNDIDTGQLTVDQQNALRHWVSSGGRLVIGGGPNAAQTISGLTQLLPFAQIETETLPHPINELRPYSGPTIEDRGPYVAAVPVKVGPGRVLVEKDRHPLIVSYDRDAGQILYIAFDLGLAPLDTIAGREQFFPNLVDTFTPDKTHLIEHANWSNMQTSLSLIPNQTLPRPGTIVLFLLLYILAVGPVNYLVLSRFKRREWAW